MPRKSKLLKGKPRGSRSKEAKERRTLRGNVRRESAADQQVVRRQGKEREVLAAGWTPRNCVLTSREYILARRKDSGAARVAKEESCDSDSEEYVETIAVTSQTSVVDWIRQEFERL